MPKPEKITFDCDDLLTKRGAKILADAITAFWQKRGHHFVVAEPHQLPDMNAWGVRSNLVNGLPPTLGLAS